jgi:hypothetical protein
MSLSSVGNPAWDTIRGVRFGMQYGPTLVAILVTHEALDAVEAPTQEAGGYIARFNRHRIAFELVATAKHDRGQMEESGAVIVQAGDLKIPGS